MGTWLKRSTSKKYTFNHEESMDQILRSLVMSEQPEGVKDGIIQKICAQGHQPTHPAQSVKGVLEVGTDWVLHGTTHLMVSSGFKLFSAWGGHHQAVFQEYFTPALVESWLKPSKAKEAHIPLLIREGLRVLSSIGVRVYYEHARAVQANITPFLRQNSTDGTSLVVRNVGLLLKEFKECIPHTVEEAAAYCVEVLQHLSTKVPPQEIREVGKFVEIADEIAEHLSAIWQLHPPELLVQCLAEIFNIISKPDSAEPAVCLAALVKHIPIDLANQVVKDVVTDRSIGQEAIAQAVSQIIDWLTWPTACQVDLWVSSFLTELAAAQKYTLLVHIIKTNIEKVVDAMMLPRQREATFRILSQMLLSFQHSPDAFHKALEKMPIVIGTLRQEPSAKSAACLSQLARLIHCLFYQHTGFPELYAPILNHIKDFPPPTVQEIQTVLKQSKWNSQSSASMCSETTPVSPSALTSVKQEKLETGKAGLDNLGNTCYMNSVIQALYMCDQFRRGILSKVPSGQESLLVKLQHVFAMLSQSSRPSISPSNFLQASRPPWFLPGHQQDCSEFMKYLLDQLHEDENSGSSDSKKFPSSGSPTGSLKLTSGSLGRASKKGAVMLTAVKFKTEEEMNGISTDSKTDSQPSLVERTFRGKVQTTMRCLACKQESRREENFSDIPLAFPNSSNSSEHPHKSLAGGSVATSINSAVESVQMEVNGSPQIPSPSEDCICLNDLLSFYLKPERLTGDNKYHCDHCNKLQDGERSIRIIESPQYLILTLLRFSYDTKLQSRTKIFHDVNYPRTLAVPVSDAPSGKDSKSSATKQHIRSVSLCSNLATKGDVQSAKLAEIARRLAPKCDYATPQHHDLYGLTAVIVHSGTSSECGHYYCYGRHSQAGQVDVKQLDQVNGNLAKLDLLPDKWYNFNDSRVSHATFESFSNVTKTFSKDTPYVLIYRKLEDVGQMMGLSAEPGLRGDLREAVTKDNEQYLQEQEVEARAKEEQRRRRSSSVSSVNLQKWRDSRFDDDDDNKRGGPPGCGGGFGGGMDTHGSRFVF